MSEPNSARKPSDAATTAERPAPAKPTAAKPAAPKPAGAAKPAEGAKPATPEKPAAPKVPPANLAPAPSMGTGELSNTAKRTLDKVFSDISTAAGEEASKYDIVDARPVRSVETLLFEEPYYFDFFQAVRLLEKILPKRNPVGRTGNPQLEAVRFRAHQSLVFPPSAIMALDASRESAAPSMEVAFMGLTGPSGVLPIHYTELIMRLRRDARGPERTQLRDWFDLFNHRMISLFYRAWEKYRFYIPFERRAQGRKSYDQFTQMILSLVGLGTEHLGDRMTVARWEQTDEGGRKKTFARVDDMFVAHYAGFFARHVRSAVSLHSMLQDYFGLPIEICQFQGQWLKLDEGNTTRLGLGNCALGVDATLGDRVWDVQGKFRVRLGPLKYAQFSEFLPDKSATPRRKAFFVLVHLTRLYVGANLDFDAQLVLAKDEVPPLTLTSDPTYGPRLGWNTWLRSKPMPKNAEDAVFQAEEVYWLNPAEAESGRSVD